MTFQNKAYEFGRVESLAFSRGYRVSEDGALINPKGKALSCWANKGGYKSSGFRHEGKTVKFFVHRLQALQKFGDAIYEAGIECRHRDGDSSNNSKSNILLGDHSKNMMDRPVEVRRRIAGNAHRKHDHAQVLAFYNDCKSYPQTMAQFGIGSTGTLHFILNKSMALEAATTLGGTAHDPITIPRANHNTSRESISQ